MFLSFITKADELSTVKNMKICILLIDMTITTDNF